ncbi:MAG: hypothetical protein JRE23_17560 [Deltaproteobacteria bacterium]|nr:hypothetical protein [Deltaproteobacteria bacterium]
MPLLEQVSRHNRHKLYYLTAAVLFLLILGVVIAYLIIRSPSQVIEQEILSDSGLTAADFLLSEEDLQYTEPKYYLFREQKKRWDREMIMRYWYPIPEILADIIAKRNDKKMESILNQ